MWIWLRYTAGGSAYNLRVNAVDVRERKFANRVQQQTLRDSEVDHLRSRRSHWDVLIGADEMVTAVNADWMEEWWCGESRFICFNSQESPVPPDNEFVQVVTDGGLSPRQWLEDHIAFPFYELTLRQKRRS